MSIKEILRRRLPARAATLACLAGVGLATLAAAPAHASTPYHVAYTGGDGVAVRYAPAANAKITPLWVLGDGTPVSIICQGWSPDGVGPRSNHIFDKIFIAPLQPERMPWIPDAYVSGTAAANQYTPGIARCGSAQALMWARQFLGTTAYSGWCAAFVRNAWLSGGVDIGGGYASAAAWASAHRSQLHTDGTPPFGATVWWWGTPGYEDGHVAISLGDGTAISTAERSYSTVHIMSIAQRNQTKPYAGWFLPGA